MKLFFLILISIFAIDSKSDESIISSKINAVLPEGMSVKSVKESQIENLFIVDGSVFVTGGGVNPTPTIQAIALKTSDYITKSRTDLKS